MRGAKGGGYWAREKLLDYETTMYHVHIGVFFALLRDRNGDFSRCPIENIFVTKKKERKKENYRKNDRRFLR